MNPVRRLDDFPSGHPAWKILTGRTPFLSCAHDPRFSYVLYVPSAYGTLAKPMPVLVAIHGTRRLIEPTRDMYVHFADRHGVAVLVPLFPAGVQDPNDVHEFTEVARRDIRFDEVVLAMVDEAAQRWELDANRFFLTGFSAGGQFVHRFAYLHPDRLRAVSVGAPGTITLLDKRPWPIGIADTTRRFGRPVDLDELRQVRFQIVVGSKDTETDVLDAISRDPRQADVGRTRVERAARLVAELKSHGVTAQLDVVDGGGHDAADVANAVIGFFEDASDQ